MWNHLTVAPDDPILGINLLFKKDTSADKVNLGVGAYRTEEGQPFILNAVKKVEQEILTTTNHEYIPIDGLEDFTKQSAILLFGKDSPALKENRVCTVQSLSGTGALRLGAAFLHQFLPKENHVVYISDPTWGNHFQVFAHAGITNQKKYRYFDKKTNGLDFAGMCEDISGAPAGAIILLHTCAHNPTGVDPTIDQWKQIISIMKEKKLIPFFDTAYQGFASGDLDRDAASVRMAIDAGLELLASQSYAKNFGLYSERTGALNIVCDNAKAVPAVRSQMKLIIRPMYSSPPSHGAHIVTKILSDPKLYDEWLVDLKAMAGRIDRMRTELYAALVERKTPGDWTHITNQIGMFSFTGLSEAQVEEIVKKYHIYMLKNGRISMAGLSSLSVVKLANAIDDVVRNIKQSNL
eukprot:TRINITY_DN7440_c0_g1_i1.p1 TRINITY_DN7440_c0_g1~~TRINITY_DN7440_c0_g1_i1.p1  ORF type:complete len:408 (-),score=97.03 TRINITY_DN7440_c0_g1_i1:79-1302(-)